MNKLSFSLLCIFLIIGFSFFSGCVEVNRQTITPVTVLGYYISITKVTYLFTIDEGLFTDRYIVEGNLPPAGYFRREFSKAQFEQFIDSMDSNSKITATPSPTLSSATLSISNVTMSVNPTEFTGACPKTFTFTGKFTLNIPASITYKLEAGSDDPAFTFTLPSPQTSNFGAGDQVVTYVLDFSNSVSGWVRLHITAPADVSSEQATFSLTCEP